MGHASKVFAPLFGDVGKNRLRHHQATVDASIKSYTFQRVLRCWSARFMASICLPIYMSRLVVKNSTTIIQRVMLRSSRDALSFARDSLLSWYYSLYLSPDVYRHHSTSSIIMFPRVKTIYISSRREARAAATRIHVEHAMFSRISFRNIGKVFQLTYSDFNRKISDISDFELDIV